jgi:hypothetical protein
LLWCGKIKKIPTNGTNDEYNRRGNALCFRNNDKMPVCGKYTNVYYLTFVMVWNIKEIPTNGT